jgi:hypothetical protein
MSYPRCYLHCMLFILGVTTINCGGDEPANVPTTGTLQVTIATTGAETDPDGYTLQVDEGPAQAIATSGSLQTPDIPPGSHTLKLNGVAANCSVAGENPRTVSVPAGQTATVSFSVTCSATTGAIRVSVETSGSPADPDGYVAKLDERDPGVPIAADQPASFTGVPAGNHTIALNGVASNCSVGQGGTRSVRVVPGVSSDVSLTIVCTAQTGSVEVTTTTTGASPDVDGYTVKLDGGTDEPVGVNATLSLPNVAPGTHSVELGGLAANCTIEGENPLHVTVAAGAPVAAAFGISCPTPAESPWTLMSSGTTMSLTSAWGSSATDVFAVGEEVACSASCTVETSILHYDGTAWAAQLTQPGILRGVWAGSPGEAFAVGADYPSYLATVLHSAGSEWSAMPSPAINVEGASILGIWGSSPTDVFAVGSLWPFGAEDLEAYVAHYDGAAWSAMQLGPTPCSTDSSRPGCLVELSHVWGSSGTDVYAVGNVHVPGGSLDRAVILHYDGAQWSQVFSESNLELRNVWGSSATDVYVTGNTLVPSSDCDDCQMRGAGAIRHFDGSSWSAMASPIGSPLGAIWGSSPTDVYLLAAFGVSGTVWHFDGASWTPINTGANGLFDIWGSSATDVFAVGENGTILRSRQPSLAALSKVSRRAK